MRFSARFLLSFFLVILFSFLVSTKAFAQTAPTATNSPTQANQYTIPNTNPDVPNNLHTWTQNVMIETLAAVTCQLSGVDPINPNQECLGVDQKTGKIGFVKNGGGTIAVMGNMITMLYTPPIHTGDYFRSIASNFGITKHAYAQTPPSQITGFDGLQPLIGLWTAFRNIVYLLFIIVFVVIGFAIMLRVKIDPRTVMTIQNQIPKLIVGILLVTFSFAIAGFLIDIMYTSMYLVYDTMAGVPNVNVSGLNPVDMQGSNPLTAINGIKGTNEIADGVATSAKDTFQKLLGIDACPTLKECAMNIFNPAKIFWDVFDPAKRTNVGNWIIDLTSYSVAGGVFWKIASIQPPQSATPVVGDAVNWFTGIVKYGTATAVAGTAFAATEFGLRAFLPYLIVYLIVFVALLFAMFRLWFALISAYIFFLLDVVFAPFWIFAGLIPGSPIGFGLWFRDILSNLAPFPVTIIMFLLEKVFIDAFANSGGIAFVPPLIGNLNNTKAFGSIIGLGFILLTPGVVAMAKTALKSPKFDTAPIKQSLGAGSGVVTGSTRNTIGSISTYAGPNASEKMNETRGGRRLINKMFEKL